MTFCAVPQVPDEPPVKVSVDGETVAALVSLEDTAMLTVAPGSVSSLTV